MMRVYHVSKGEYAQEIWNNGIKSEPPEAEWVEQRRNMRDIIDRKGNKIHKDWIDRKDSVFFWSTHERAMRYAQKFVNPAICEIDAKKDFWCLPNTQLETIFDDFRQDEEIEEEVERMVRRSTEHKQCILQGKCEECGSINDNYTVTSHEHKSSSVDYGIVCECGEEVTVRITKNGLSTNGAISYTEASWTSKSELQREEEAENAENEEEEEGLNRENNKMQ